MKSTLPLLALLFTLSSAFPHSISARSVTINPSNKNVPRAGTDTAAGILNIIGSAIPGPAGAIVGDVGKGLGGGKAAGAGAGTGTAAAGAAATTGNAKAKAGAAGGATKAAGKKAEKAA